MTIVFDVDRFLTTILALSIPALLLLLFVPALTRFDTAIVGLVLLTAFVRALGENVATNRG